METAKKRGQGGKMDVERGALKKDKMENSEMIEGE